MGEGREEGPVVPRQANYHHSKTPFFLPYIRTIGGLPILLWLIPIPSGCVLVCFVLLFLGESNKIGKVSLCVVCLLFKCV